MGFFDILKGRSRFEKAADGYKAQVDRINSLEKDLEGLSDEEIKNKVQEYSGMNLSEVLKHTDEIFASTREAAKRTLKMRHFDVQIMGGLSMLDSKIAEMKTGEGKTLVATLPLVLHALTKQGAHLVTVNDYLSSRDAEWMRPVYEFLGLTVGVVVAGMSSEEKREAYAADITYGTNNEFGFDYLRDNMASDVGQLVQRKLNFAIVDEVDSILIDESRTPLIISAPDTESAKSYEQFAKIVPTLEENNHYNIDEKRKAVTLTDDGISKIEEILGIDNIYEEKGIRMVHHLEQALRAQVIYYKDKDYVVKDGQVYIVDEFTGRLMEGRRYSEGLHQAIEAKEGVKVQQESRTLATITFQNFFRLYNHLAGMTGTAVTSAEEFEKVYSLEVVVIPTNKELVRQDLPDRIYITEKDKFKACVTEIKKRHKNGQPILVGTIAIEKSEHLSKLLQREGVEHEVLNAKHHAREAEIISQAGQKGAVTISTNMAGRGTDIKLGSGVKEAGGLFVLGTERHEARRIDNQLRGRSGRQGDPGATQFFISLDDDIMRIFGGSKVKGLLQRLKIPEGEAIENRMISRTIAGAQERVEGYYFDMRKQVLSYDNVLNKQRDAIYTLRRGVLRKKVWKESNKEAVSLIKQVPKLIDEQANNLVVAHTTEGQPSDWDIEEMAETIHSLAGIETSEARQDLSDALRSTQADGPIVARKKISDIVATLLNNKLKSKRKELGGESLLALEKAATIRSIDIHWMNHLDTMDYLRTGIGLRGYGQRDPLVEYQKEGYKLFQELLGVIKFSIVETVFKAQAIKEESEQGQAKHESVTAPHRISDNANTNPEAAEQEQLENPYKGIGRNDPCPCGSGKKFKKCHGANS